MLNIGSMGAALREIGSGFVQVVTRMKDFNMIEVPSSPQEQTKTVTMHPVDQLFAFTAVGFRELGETDVWEFRVMEQTPGGPVQSLLYMRGSDIFWVKAASRVQVGAGG